MRTFTIAQIKYHFNGEPYVDCPEFIGQLVQHKILIKIDVNRYTYAPTMTREQSRTPLLHTHGDLTSLAPHERLSELPVIPREKSDTGAAAGENPRDAPVIAR